MKDPSKLVSPKALPKGRNLEIVEMVKSRPDLSYYKIAERFGVSFTTVSRIACAHGVKRGDPVVNPKPRKLDPNRREGGIIANDAQWRARQERIR